MAWICPLFLMQFSIHLGCLFTDIIQSGQCPHNCNPHLEINLTFNVKERQEFWKVQWKHRIYVKLCAWQSLTSFLSHLHTVNCTVGKMIQYHTAHTHLHSYHTGSVPSIVARPQHNTARTHAVEAFVDCRNKKEQEAKRDQSAREFFTSSTTWTSPLWARTCGMSDVCGVCYRMRKFVDWLLLCILGWFGSIWGVFDRLTWTAEKVPLWISLAKHTQNRNIRHCIKEELTLQ